MARRVFIGGSIFFAAVSFGVARAAIADVSISGNAYSPQTIRIVAGDTVEWTNAETPGLLTGKKTRHTVTADDGSFGSGTLSPGDRFSQQFSTAGTYPYSCTIHPNMHGLVVVLAPRPSATPTPTATATQTARATPKTTPSRTTAASASPSPSPTDSVVASAIGGGGSSAGVIASVAIVAIAVLTLLGWFVYVRFIRET